MLDSMQLPLLLAQEQSTFVDTLLKGLIIIGIFFAVLVLPFLLGSFVAKKTRMRGYDWKIGTIVASLAVATLILVRSWDSEAGQFDIPLGVDLKGGVILIYQASTEGGFGDAENAKRQGDDEIDMDALVQALANRINPSGTKEIVIRPYGERQVEIIIPEVDPIEVEQIKKLIGQAGALQFRIVANERDHSRLLSLAEAQSKNPEAKQRTSKELAEVDAEGKRTILGFWVEAAGEKLRAADVAGNTLRNPKTGELVDVTSLGSISDAKQTLADFLSDGRANGNHDIERLEILMSWDDLSVTGDDLGVVSASVDERLNPCVNFQLRGGGVRRFQLLTSENLPDVDSTPAFYRHLGIVLDNRLLSFPRLITTISDSGRITGDFTQDEVEFLVNILRAGRLPATLERQPISENQIGSMLGDDTIKKGKQAIAVSLLAVLVFVALYYRFSGIIACLALLTNLVLILAVMVMLNAPLTLPGLAGLVLTVGMSVDANVLIFERIREELQRGAALRMAIRNGFARATTTIVDANVTTLITATVLYVIGTDQIRGFAVTLWLGIVMSMYTAIFCSRVVFDIAERQGWIKELKMMRILGATALDFVAKRRIAAVASTLLIVIGLAAVVYRGQGIFDIDFTGGASVTMVLKDSMEAQEVRDRLDDHFLALDPPVRCSVNTVSVEDRPANSVYKIDAGINDTDLLESSIKKVFRNDAGESLLLTYSMSFGDPKQVAIESAKTDVSTKPAKTDEVEAKTESAKTESEKTDAEVVPEKTPPGEKKSAESPVTEKPPAKKRGDPKSEEAGVEKKAAEKIPATKPSTDGKTSLRTDLPSDGLLALALPVSLQETEAKQDPKADPKEDPKERPGQDPKEDSKQEAKQEAKTESNSDAKGNDSNADGKSDPDTSTGEFPAGKKTESEAAESDDAVAKAVAPRISSVTRLTFEERINAPTLIEMINLAYGKIVDPGSTDVDSSKTPGGDSAADTSSAGDAGMTRAEVPGLFVDIDEVFDWDQASAVTSNSWYVSMSVLPEDAKTILQQLKLDMASMPVFPSSSEIGGKVAGDTRNLAFAALVASLFGIVGYIWIRFQRVVFGVAAVIALVHDVLITLGAIAVSAFLAGPLGFLLIDEFKISLPMVAAFMTIIGYSLNDTIVVFDRIREVRGKSPDLTPEMVNASINQTLSRTLLTSMTTLIVVLILYVMGGQGIHGFAFALVIGVLVGTYSSVFVATPALLWLFNRNQAADGSASRP